jgi:hypothetical protein
MELLQIDANDIQDDIIKTERLPMIVSTAKPFIEANTFEYSLEEIRNKHIIPVFIKDNEPLISHADFVEATTQVVADMYHYETILKPNIRLSHPIKGRTPEAKDKPAIELLEHEKTIHYERMAFVIEVPSVYDKIEGNKLSLVIGGVRLLISIISTQRRVPMNTLKSSLALRTPYVPTCAFGRIVLNVM